MQTIENKTKIIHPVQSIWLHSLSDTQIEQLCDLYQKQWWAKGRTLAQSQTVVEKSSKIYARINLAGELVAFARVLSDSVFKAWIFDVMIHEDYQEHGLGSEVIGTILEDIAWKNVKHFELYCKENLESYYERFGFCERIDGGDVVVLRRLHRQD